MAEADPPSTRKRTRTPRPGARAAAGETTASKSVSRPRTTRRPKSEMPAPKGGAPRPASAGGRTGRVATRKRLPASAPVAAPAEPMPVEASAPPLVQRRYRLAGGVLVVLLLVLAVIGWRLSHPPVEVAMIPPPTPVPKREPAPAPPQALPKPVPAPVTAAVVVPPLTVASLPPTPAPVPAAAEGAAPPPGKGVVYEEELAGKEHTQAVEPRPPARRPHPEEALPAASEPTVAVVIDDLGYNGPVSMGIARLNADITLAILPYGQHSREVAELGKRLGREVILHQPMEPMGYPKVSPGPGALLNSMDPNAVRETLRKNLDKFPEAVGVNNHMGSRFTQNAVGMGAVMEELHKRGLFFVDSRTAGGTKGGEQAIAHQVPRAGRDVFLDNVQQAGQILSQLHQLEERARKGRREAIGIGHPYPETLEALKRWLPEAQARGVKVVRVSQLLGPVTARAKYAHPAPALAMRKQPPTAP